MNDTFEVELREASELGDEEQLVDGEKVYVVNKVGDEVGMETELGNGNRCDGRSRRSRVQPTSEREIKNN